MNSRLNSDIYEWAQSVMSDADRSGFSGINAVERILRDPGIATSGSQHRVHWWPKNRRIAKMSAAAHVLSKIELVCLFVDVKVIFNDRACVDCGSERLGRPIWSGEADDGHKVYRCRDCRLEQVGSTNVFTHQDLKRNSSLTVAEIRAHIRAARRKLRVALYG